MTGYPHWEEAWTPPESHYPRCHIYIAVEPVSGCNHNSYTHPLIQQKVSLSSPTRGIHTAVSNATELLVFKPRRAQCLRHLSFQGHNHLTKITWKGYCSLLEPCALSRGTSGTQEGICQALSSLPSVCRYCHICCDDEELREIKQGRDDKETLRK